MQADFVNHKLFPKNPPGLFVGFLDATPKSPEKTHRLPQHEAWSS